MKRPLLCLAGGFVLGEVCGLRCKMAVILILTAAAVFFAARLLPEAVGHLRKKSADPKRGPVLFSALRQRLSQGIPALWAAAVALAAAAGLLRGAREYGVWEREQAAVGALSGSVHEFSGRLSGLTDRGEQWELLLSGVRAERAALRRVIVYLPKTAGEARPRLGALLCVRGRAEAFEPAGNPGQFDFRDYYRAKKTSCRVRGEALSGRGRNWSVFRDFLWQCSDRAAGILKRSAEPEAAGLFCAILLGDKTGLSADIRSLYQKSGIAHLLAVSGLHLSLVGLAGYGLLRRAGLGFGLSGVLGGAFLSAYAVMTGFQPSVMRALVMSLCGYLAAYLGRTYDLKSALALAGILVLWDSPYELTQAGVQLSFAAVGSIAFAAPAVRERWRAAFADAAPAPVRGAGGVSAVREKLVEMRGRGTDALAFGFALQAGSFPIVLYHFFQIPLYGMFLNLLVIPLMSAVVLSGALGIACGTAGPAAARFALSGGERILELYEFLCRVSERLPCSALILGRPRAWQSGAYYGCFFAWLCLCEKKSREEAARKENEIPENAERGSGGPLRRTAVALAPAALALLLLPLPLPGFQADFLDVGQGDGICLRTDGAVILMDGGSTSGSEPGKDILEPFLKSCGIRTVDYAVVSHGDEDHVNGLRYLLEERTGIRVKNLILPAAGRGDPVYGELERLAAGRGGRVFWFAAGDRLRAGRLTLSCLYPARGGTVSEDRNEHSLAFLGAYEELRLLFTGDMSAEGERALLASAGTAKESLRAGILKVAHHGSRYSSCAEFLEAVSPELAVISCAAKNRYGHPAPETTERLRAQGTRLLLTMERGAVTVCSDGRRLRQRCFRNAPLAPDEGDGKGS